MNIKNENMIFKIPTLYFMIGLMSFFACETANNTQKLNETKMTQVISNIDSIKYHVYSRGYQEMYIATPESLQISTPKGGEKTMDISLEDWNNLTKNLTEDWVKQMPEVVSPTMNYASDADLAANITISMQGETYISKTFDKSTPPKEFVDIIATLTKISSK